jgi:Sec-independent protein secretion pathway component TatC
VVTVTVMMMAPLVLLYEFSILLSVLIYRRRERHEIGGEPPEGAVGTE